MPEAVNSDTLQPGLKACYSQAGYYVRLLLLIIRSPAFETHLSICKGGYANPLGPNYADKDKHLSFGLENHIISKNQMEKAKMRKKVKMGERVKMKAKMRKMVKMKKD